jgi:hypothetical protein
MLEILRPTVTSKPRDEGPTGLQVPVAAAKEEQLAQHAPKLTDAATGPPGR